jgi:hypothetical protein
MPWVPFSKRQTAEETKAYLELRDGFPDGVCIAMLQFVSSLIYGPRFGSYPIGNRDLANEFYRRTDTQLLPDWEAASRQFWQDRELLLDVCDFIAQQLAFGEYRSVEHIREFNLHLEQARSIYVVRANGIGSYAVQQHVGEQSHSTLEVLANLSDAGAQLMTRAWNKAFGLTPDYSAACMDAIRAIEVVAQPVFSVNDEAATLGKMLSAYRDKPVKWVGTIADPQMAEVVVAGLNMLWTNHPRHGDDEKHYVFTRESTHHFLLTALWLFELLRNGAIRTR